MEQTKKSRFSIVKLEERIAPAHTPAFSMSVPVVGQDCHHAQSHIRGHGPDHPCAPPPPPPCDGKTCPC